LGSGIDVRARHSWESYPPETQAHLHVRALDPLGNLEVIDDLMPRGTFVIANHADELTPWTPVLSTLRNVSGYISIPCCAWSFDARFQRGIDDSFVDSSNEVEGFVDNLALGGEGTSSSYAAYRIWLARLARTCGWKIECDTLRIPSTRNWAIVGMFSAENHCLV
jgi:tRNASer (uridine44-2'-O)-methyltransferase